MSTIAMLGSCSDAKPVLQSSEVVAASETQSEEIPINASPSSTDTLTVYKSATCDCCHKWVEHIDDAGIITAVNDTQNISSVKQQHGILNHQRSCHTAILQQGYVFEGHIPARFIRQLWLIHQKGQEA